MKAEVRPRLRDHYAFEGLQALAVTFLDLDLHDDGVARGEFRHLLAHLLGFKRLDRSCCS